MCGIAGFFGDFPPRLLDVMHSAMPHRGPDGYGTWYNTNAQIGLAHRRLSIIDLSTAASQPMACVGDRYQIVFNGEIYNFKELHKYIEADYEFNLNSDTAVLAPLYHKFGPDMLNYLNGMFTFAIWDEKDRTLFIARDHLGVKPLYYTITPRGLAFASELKPLLHLQDLDMTLNPNALQDYLTYLWCPGEGTPFQNIKKLNPGHYLKSHLHHTKEWPQPTRYFTPPLNVPEKPKTSNNLWITLKEAVQRQSIADVPVGAFLSGGVDSSAIVAAMVANGQPPAQTYCMTFPGGGMEQEGFTDDSQYAKMVAQHLGVPLKMVEADPAGLDKLPELVELLEEPLADPAPLYVQTICQAARDDGLKVLHSGTGGDDLFGGYRRHQAMLWYSQFKPVAPLIRYSIAAAQACFKGGATARRLERLKYIFSTTDVDALHRAFEFSPSITTSKLLSQDILSNQSQKYQNALKTALRSSEGNHPLKRLLFMELHGFLPDHNLTYTDKAAMNASVEVRVPLLDLELLNFAAGLPVSQQVTFQETKILLKKSLEHVLPKEVLYRSKAGFGAPVRKWLCEDRQDLVQDILFDQTTKQRGIFNPIAAENLYGLTKSQTLDGAYTVLSMLMIELWCRRFIDQKPQLRL